MNTTNRQPLLSHHLSRAWQRKPPILRTGAALDAGWTDAASVARLIRVVRGRYEAGYSLRRLVCASALSSDLLGGLCVLAGAIGALVVDDVLEGVSGFFIGLALGAALVGMGIPRKSRPNPVRG